MVLDTTVLHELPDEGVSVAADVRPDWFYVVDATDGMMEALKDFPGTWVHNGRLLVHRNLVVTDDRFNSVYDDAAWCRDCVLPQNDAKLDDLLKKLRPYQREYVEFAIKRPGTVNADDLGTGKTLQALSVAYATQKLPVLIVGTLLTKSVWTGSKGEPAKWLNVDVRALEGRKSANPDIFHEPNDGWWFIHYDVLEAWIPYIFGTLRPQVVVFDEAHNATPKTKRGTAAEAVSRFKEIKRRIVLTATPIRNRRIDLWSVLNLAAPEGFGSKHQFGVFYCAGVHGEYSWEYNGESRNAELKSRMNELMVRRTKAEVMTQLPPMTRQATEVEISKSAAEEYAKYKSAEHNIRKFLAGEGKKLAAGIKGEELVRITKMLAILSQAKKETTLELALEAANNTGKVVVFCWFKDVAKFICERLRKKKIKTFGPITGDVPIKKRISQAEKFAETIQPAAYVATLAAASESINQLAACQQMINNDLYWKPLTLLQAEGRLHRGGQKGAVHVNYVVAKGTIDAYLLEALTNKANASAAVGIKDDGQALVRTLGSQEVPPDDFDALLSQLQKHTAEEGFEFDGETW